MNEHLTMKTAVATTGTSAVAADNQVSSRPIVAVLGMHRSGTSLCAHVLSCLGIDMADELLVNGGNAKGHWERLELTAFHDRMLTLCNRGYFTPLHDLALPEAWWADPQIQTVKREIVGFLQRRIGAMSFGFKDPRTARLLPVWNQIFRELNLAPKFVLCLRNPAQVARSLRDRDHHDPEIGEYRWFVYLTDIFKYIGEHEFCLVEYEDWFAEPGRNLRKLQQFLKIEWPGSEADLHLTVSEIVDGELRHDDPRCVQAREPTIRAFYELVQAFPVDSAARQRTRYLTTQFAAYRSLQRPFERAFENAQALADKVVPLEQEIAKLQTFLGERDAEIARLGATTTAVQVELDGRNAELGASRQSSDEQLAAAEGLRAALVDAERTVREAVETADGAAAELIRTQADLATRDAALVEARQMGAEWDAAMEFLQADLVRLHAESAARDAELVGMRAAAIAARVELAVVEQRCEGQQEAVESLQAELAARDAALAVAEDEAQQRDAVSAMIEAEVVALRDRLAQAEREAQQGRASAATLAVEIVALQGSLAAARQVGRTAIAALQIGMTAPSIPDEPRGWRHAVMRLFGVHGRLSNRASRVGPAI
jgi:hypothetical protein